MSELEVRDIGKTYKEKIAVKSINVKMKRGIYGLLGENGAGKTTLMRMICGILEPTQGTVLYDGLTIKQLGPKYRRLLGYLPQDFGYYREFSAKRFLTYMAALKVIPEETVKQRIEELLDIVELQDVRDKKLKTFSGGMLRRIGIAQALLNDPEILILDEPTAGLDPKERVRFRNIISSLGKNRIIMLSTHIVSDVEYIADQILIMKHGELIRMGTEAELSKATEGCVWKCLVSGTEAERLNSRYVISNLRNRDGKVELRIVSKEKPLPEAEAVSPVLEDVYLYYVQNPVEKGSL